MLLNEGPNVDVLAGDLQSLESVEELESLFDDRVACRVDRSRLLDALNTSQSGFGKVS
jgi:hypothetical protein